MSKFDYKKYEHMLSFVYDKDNKYLIAMVNKPLLDVQETNKLSLELVDVINNLTDTQAKRFARFCKVVMSTPRFIDFDSKDLSAGQITFTVKEIDSILNSFIDVKLMEDGTDIIYSVKALVHVLNLLLNRKDFNEYLELLMEYKEEHKHVLISPSEWYDGYPLGMWLSRVRNSYQISGLEVEKEKLLQGLGVVLGEWDKTGWTFKYKEARKYYKKHKNLQVPFGTMVSGFNLYSWVCFQKQRHMEGKLDKSKVAKLEKIGITWSEGVVDKWEKKYAIAEDYFKEFGSLNTKRNENYGGIALDSWLNNQRRARRGEQNRNITEEQIVKLDKLNMRW